MRAVVYFAPQNVQFKDNYPEPTIKSGTDVKLKVHYCGICGSDLHEYQSGPTFFAKEGQNHAISNKAYPHVMGHEMSAEIVEIGSDVKDFKVGDSVVVEVTGTCLDRDRFEDSPTAGEEKCAACKDGHYNMCKYLGLTGLGFSDGGFAEYVVTNSSKLVKFDSEKIPYDVAALIQPLAVSWHAVRTSNFKAGSSALVLGGGPIGLTTIIALKGHGAGKILVSEPSAGRRAIAEKLGVETFDPLSMPHEETMEKLKLLAPDKQGFHYSYDCAGTQSTFDGSIRLLRVRGVATNVAVWAHKPINYFPMIATWSEIWLRGSICFVKQDFEEVARALEEGRIELKDLEMLITAKISLERAVTDGFDELLRDKEKHIKMLFSPLEQFKDKKTSN